jgi:hypothetical protein
MFPHQFPPPPPPTAGFVPPPPLEVMKNPLEVRTEWNVDVLTENLKAIFEVVPTLQNRFGTTLSLVAGGDEDSEWARFTIRGLPIGIHHTVGELKRAFRLEEAGFSVDDPLGPSSHLGSNRFEDEVPVYHAAWTEYSQKIR